MKKKIKAVVVGLAGFYLVLCLGVSLTQRNVMYHPNRPERIVVPDPASEGVAGEKITVTTADGLALASWFHPPKEEGGVIVLYLHGNAGNIMMRKKIAQDYAAQGYGYLFLEYRGFGGNPGSPEEEGLYKDARGALGWLKDRGYKTSQVVYYGESLGTGIATQLALEQPPMGLILQSAYTSMAAMARRFYWFLPVDLLLRDEYDTIKKIGKVRAPVLVIHGLRDGLIPVQQGRAVFAAAADPKEYAELPEAGHNDPFHKGGAEKTLEWIEKLRK